MCKLRQRGREYAGPAESSRGIDPSLQPLPYAAIADAVLDGQAASRRPSHAFRLNPNSGPVYPACDIECCTVRWPVGEPLLYALISQKALAGRVIHHDTAFLAAYAVSGSVRHRHFVFGAAGAPVRANQPFHEFGHGRNITPLRSDFITDRTSWTRVRP